MLVSAVVCTHNPAKYRNLVEALKSLMAQSYELQEIIIVVDGSRELYMKILADYGECQTVKTVLLEKSLGVSEARNAGIRIATGVIIAFMDDDAAAATDWIEQLVTTYERYDALAVAGKILPAWEVTPVDFPEELYWLVGATHRGFAGETVMEVRNAFGPNMSFRRDVFQKIGGFRKELGFAEGRTTYIQAEETDLAIRLKSATGRGVMYNPQAVVHHKVPAAKLKLQALLKRSFFQGYSKAMVRQLNSQAGSLAVEQTYLKQMALRYIPQRLKRAYRFSQLRQGLLLISSVALVAMGFVYGYVHKRPAATTPGIDSLSIPIS